MARLRVDSSHFANNFSRPLSSTRFPTRESSLALSEAPSPSTEALHALLVSLKSGDSSSLDEAIKYLAQENANNDFLGTDYQDPALKEAVLNEVAVGLYARGLDVYLSEATEIEAEAEWWANVERSSLNVAWFFLQTLPSRLTRALRTILNTVREQGLPFQLSLLTPSSLFRLFPSTTFQPSALTTALFPHLKDQQTFVSLLWTRRPSRVPQIMQCIWSTSLLPFHLTREECRYKRRKLEQLRDERAEQLGRLAHLRLVTTPADLFPSQLASSFHSQHHVPGSSLHDIEQISSVLIPSHVVEHGVAIQELRRPSSMVLLWPKLLLLPPLALYTIKTLYASRASIAEMALEAKETVEGFIKNSLIDPLKEILKTVRTGGEDGVIVRREGVMADLDSLERMTLSLARDKLNYSSTQLEALSKQIRVGDLTPVLEIYEEDIKRPVKSALTGTLLRSLFIQVQKAKVDIDQALSGIDKLLKSQELTFAFVGLAPALVVVALATNYVSRIWGGGLSKGRFGGRSRRASVWAAMRRIERLLVSQTSSALSPQTTGLLLISVARLRAFAESSLPHQSRLREGFLEDVGDLEDPAMAREDKLRVVERMWRSWGRVLGWSRVAAEEVLGI